MLLVQCISMHILYPQLCKVLYLVSTIQQSWHTIPHFYQARCFWVVSKHHKFCVLQAHCHTSLTTKWLPWFNVCPMDTASCKPSDDGADRGKAVRKTNSYSGQAAILVWYFILYLSMPSAMVGIKERLTKCSIPWEWLLTHFLLNYVF